MEKHDAHRLAVLASPGLFYPFANEALCAPLTLALIATSSDYCTYMNHPATHWIIDKYSGDTQTGWTGVGRSQIRKMSELI